MSSEHCSVSLLRRGQLWSVPSISAGPLLLFRHLEECRDRVVFHGGGGGGGGDVMTFLGLSCLPRMLHLSSKLF